MTTDPSMAQTMRALVLEEFGAPLHAKIRAGGAPHARVSVPAILGMDLAGVVTGVGPGVTRFTSGDEVYGMTGGVGDQPGSLAEYSASDADLLALKPARLSMAQAAGGSAMWPSSSLSPEARRCGPRDGRKISERSVASARSRSTTRPHRWMTT